jgi:hypothetical protein
VMNGIGDSCGSDGFCEVVFMDDWFTLLGVSLRLTL